MTINFKQIAVMVVFLAVAALSGSPTLGQQPLSPARLPALRVIKWNGDIAYILFHLSQAYDGTIGLEVDPQRPQTDVGFYLEKPSLPDVLNTIVQAAPRYQWRERDGVFEVLPLAGTNPLLDTMIYNFRVNDVDQEAAFNQLLNLPEVQAGMKAMNLSRRDATGRASEVRVEKVSLSLDGVTLRQGLSRIAQASCGRFWIFRQYRDGSFSISGSPW